MKDLQNMLEKYRTADDEKRLYLFLECRPLRNEFVQIELEAYQTSLQDGIDSGKKPAKGSVWRSLWAGFAFDKL